MGQGQRILHLSNSADTNNYIYDTVVVGTNSTVTLNGTQYTFSGGTVVKMVVKSVEVGSPNVYLSGFLTTFMFPSYIGNPGSSYNIDEIATYIATEHYNRVIADGGVIPAGINQLKTAVTTLITIYNITDGVISNEPSVKNIQLTNIRNNLNSTIPIFIDPHYVGYKLGAGSGTTLGQAAQTLYSLAGASADVRQTTAASQPLLLAHTGENYWFGSGVAGNFIQTPNAVANQITGDIELIAYVDYKNNGGAQTILSNYNGAGNGFSFLINSSNNILTEFFVSTVYISAISTASIGASFTGYLKVTREASTGIITFYTSINGTTYTQLGSALSRTSGNLTAGTLQLLVGAYSTTLNNFQGKIYRATISNSIGGTPVVDFNPASYNPSVSQTQWTSATGEVWSLNVGTATTGYKGVLVNRTILQSDAIDDFISITGLTSRQYFTRYVACIPYTNPNTAPRIISGNADTHLIFKSGANAFEAFNGVQLAFTGEVVNILQALIVDYNSTNSKTFVNNAGETSGNTGTSSSTAISLFGSVMGTTLSNAVINTVIQPITIDNATIRTSVYNYLKQINNGAF